MQTDPKPIPQVPAYPNLLRADSPVLLSESYAATFGRPSGIIFDLGNEKALVAYHEDYRPALIPLSELRLDLTTDTGMCHAARWLAERLGMDPGVTAPLWYRVTDPEGDSCWFLKSYTACGEVHMHGFRIASVADPAEALAAACVAVGGAS